MTKDEESRALLRHVSEKLFDKRCKYPLCLMRVNFSIVVPSETRSGNPPSTGVKSNSSQRQYKIALHLIAQTRHPGRKGAVDE